MKTANEFAAEACTVLDWAPPGYIRHNLQTIFQAALDQSALQWQDGPPKERGDYLCRIEHEHGGKKRNFTMHVRVGGGMTGYVDRVIDGTSEVNAPIICHIGPIPDAPEKPKVLVEQMPPEEIIEIDEDGIVHEVHPKKPEHQSLAWKDGPPKEDGKHLCEMKDVVSKAGVVKHITRHEGANFYVEQCSLDGTNKVTAEILSYIGPIPDPPKKPEPEPLFRRFECYLGGVNGEGVKLSNGVCHVKWKDRAECIHYERNFNESIITKWLDPE